MNWKMIWKNRHYERRHHHRRFYQPRTEVLESREMLSAAPLLHIGPDGRHLLTSSNQPFYMVGDSAWSLALSLTESDASYYFQQRAAQGFNTVLMDSVGLSSITGGSSTDKNGNVPFNGFLPGTSTYDVSTIPAAGDTTSSAGKYWQHIDNLISTAAANGIEVVFDVYDTYSPWFQTNGRDGNSPSATAKLQAYGQFLGKRYGAANNIIWMFGNDYFASSAGNADMAAVIQGIRQFDTTHVITMEMDSAAGYPAAAFDNSTLRQYVTLNGIYLYNTGPYRSTYLGQYNRTDFGPTFNIETGYETNSGIGVTPAKLRSGHYSFLLDGAIGDLYGNERVGGAFSGGPFAADWKTQMNSQGAHEMTYFGNLLSSVAWYNLVPDQNGTVFQGVGSPTDYSGARSADGTLAIAYKPPSGSGGQSFTVHMNQFAGAVTAQWYDPTNGTYINIGSGLANSGNQTFTSPAANSAGQNDFVLVLKATTAAPATPIGLSATGSNGQIALSWSAANGAASYNIYRSTTAGGEGSTPYRTGITAASFTDTGLTNGTRYYYQVSGVNSVGQSGKSGEVSAVPQLVLPSTPTGLSAAAGNGQIALSWNAASGATSYNIYRSTTAGGEGSTAYRTGITAASFTDTGLTNGTRYYYQISAVNSAGQSGKSSEVSAVPQVPAANGLVLALGFNEGSGTTAADSSGNGNRGTLNGATWSTSGKFNNALTFNGSNALVNIADSASLHLTAGMTLEAWVNPSTVANAWRDVIYKGSDDNYYLEGSSPQGSPAAGGTFSPNPVYAAATLSANNWSYLAATYDGATLRIFVNGVQVASRAQTGSIATSSGVLTIGGDPLYGQYFAGRIDEVRIYNRALSGAEIQTDMNTPIGTSQVAAPALTGDYNLNNAVDAADYISWRKANGGTVPVAFNGADGNGDLRIGAEDYSVWRANVGQAVPQGSGGAALALTVSAPFIDANVSVQGSVVDAKSLTTITGVPAKSEVPYAPFSAQRSVFEKNSFAFASGIGSPSGHHAAMMAAIKYRSSVLPEHVGDALLSLLANASSFRTTDENLPPASSASSADCIDETRNAALDESFDNFI